MRVSTSVDLDPDRYVRFSTPGAQEWWYFDAVSDDGRDALVIVWYAGLPFDPSYGVGTLKHLRSPEAVPAPDALDHCAIGLSWYRDGKTLAYALNAHRRGAFEHRDDPFGVRVASSQLSRSAGGYELRVETPTKDGASLITARLDFVPAERTQPLELDLGEGASRHLWMLAAADCRVKGEVEVRGALNRKLRYQGRGYHDHNAGAEEISLAMRRWRWGRVHLGETTHVYYEAQPRHGANEAVWVECERGEPILHRETVEIEEGRWSRNWLGVAHDRSFRLRRPDAELSRRHVHCVDTGPFYLRWLSEYEEAARPGRPARRGVGISELLDTRKMNHPLFNWMIPYRLKRPGETIEA